MEPRPKASAICQALSTCEHLAERRYAIDQALASTRLSGHVPTAEFLADCKAYVTGELTDEDVCARSLAPGACGRSPACPADQRRLGGLRLFVANRIKP